jgi:hypothetical protein
MHICNNRYALCVILLAGYLKRIEGANLAFGSDHCSKGLVCLTTFYSHGYLVIVPWLLVFFGPLLAIASLAAIYIGESSQSLNVQHWPGMVEIGGQRPSAWADLVADIAILQVLKRHAAIAWPLAYKRSNSLQRAYGQTW